MRRALQVLGLAGLLWFSFHLVSVNTHRENNKDPIGIEYALAQPVQPAPSPMIDFDGYGPGGEGDDPPDSKAVVKKPKKPKVPIKKRMLADNDDLMKKLSAYEDQDKFIRAGVFGEDYPEYEYSVVLAKVPDKIRKIYLEYGEAVAKVARHYPYLEESFRDVMGAINNEAIRAYLRGDTELYEEAKRVYHLTEIRFNCLTYKLYAEGFFRWNFYENGNVNIIEIAGRCSETESSFLGMEAELRKYDDIPELYRLFARSGVLLDDQLERLDGAMTRFGYIEVRDLVRAEIELRQ